MNAVTDLQGAEATLDHLPIQCIRPSRTAVQTERRAHFNAERLLELAASIQANGVLQPILVRPVKPEGTIKFEIVAGERRFIAADRAGLALIPATIRELSEDQVIEAQLVENLQREGITALQEATGYRALLDLHKGDKDYNADTIAEKIGKSRSYVYTRLKLLDLIPAARSALAAGVLDTSKALLLARIVNPTLQEKAYARITETLNNGDPMFSYRDAFSELRRNFMTPLQGAPFDISDAELTKTIPAAGKRDPVERLVLPACLDCPHFSGNDVELRAELGPDAHVCTDRSCYDAKVTCIADRRRAAVEATGAAVLAGEAAKKIMPRKDKIVGHVDLDETCEWDDYPEPAPDAKDATEAESPEFKAKYSAWEDRMEAWTGRTYRQLLGDAKITIVLVEDPKTKQIREMVPLKQAREILAKKADINVPSWVRKPEPPRQAQTRQPQVDYKEEQRKAEERRQQEEQLRLRILKAVAEKCGGPIKRDDLVDIADALFDELGHHTKQVFRQIYAGKLPEPSSLKDTDLGKFIRLAMIASCALHYQAPTALLAAAKRYKIDPAKIKKQMADEEKAAKAKTDKPAPPAAAKEDGKPKAKAKKKAVKK